MSTNEEWKEVFDGGSKKAEEEIFRSLAADMLGIQEHNRLQMNLDRPLRTLHAKMVVGIANASLVIDRALPTEFANSYFQPGASLPVALRLSNASSMPQADSAPDMRGAAIRVQLPDGGRHDLLMTSFPTSHARNARQFVEFAVLAAGDKTTFPARLIEHFGAQEAERMIANLRQGIRASRSFAVERFWSRGAVLWAGHPVRFQLRPDAGSAAAPAELPSTNDALRDEFSQRLLGGPVRFRLALQRYTDEQQTPIEDGAVEWAEETTPPIDVATVLIPRQDLSTEEGLSGAAEVERMAFNPWNAPAEFRPLGNLNRVRGVVYGESAKKWRGVSA